MDNIKKRIDEATELFQRISQSSSLLQGINEIVDQIVETFRGDGKVLLCGNGGSAADAQHLAAEFSGRFYYDRAPLFAEALHVNTSYITAVGNDYGYEEIYERLVRAKGRVGDVLIGLSTSGNSPNVIKAIEYANSIGMNTIGLTGEGECKMKGICKHLIAVPSSDTPRIQEAHIMIGHIICELVEKELFPENK